MVLLIIGIIVGAFLLAYLTSLSLNHFPKSKIIFQILYPIIIVVLAYLVYESVMEPVRFNKEKSTREEMVVKHLQQIRDAQVAYKTLKGKYAADFDSLLLFVRTAEFPIIKMVPDPEDTTFTKTIRDTLGFRNVADSLYKEKAGNVLKTMRFIPFSDGEQFDLAAGAIDKGGVSVAVFEAKAHYTTFLKGLDKQLILNLIDAQEAIERYPGLKVGSMNEASTDGNWE